MSNWCCPFERVRDYHGCYEDCPDTEQCKPAEARTQTETLREATPIVFKTEDSLWRMLASGEKRFDMRRWDLADDRIYRLSWGRFGPKGEWVPVEDKVCFLNKATGETACFEYQGVEFAPWAPGWGFILLEGRRED